MLAVFSAPDAARADALLAGVVADLRAAHVPVAGCLQDARMNDAERVTRWLRMLDGSADMAITQDLGAGAAGCSLDPGALARASHLIAAQLPRARMLVLNRFGRSEAEGGGFRPLIAMALEAGTPVLTVVPDRYRAAFADFAGGMECWLDADPAALRGWCAAQGIMAAGGIDA